MPSRRREFFHGSSAGVSSSHPKIKQQCRDSGFSRYRDTCKTLRDVSIGSQTFGKAKVDCCFYGSESKWGVIESNDAGIVYFGLTLSQNSDYRLDWIDIHMSFKADEGTTSSPPTVLKYIAPQILWGPEREEQIGVGVKINAQADVPGITSFNLGEFNRTKDYKRTQKWSFRGDRLADEAGSGLYQIVRWSWDSNPNEPQGEVRHLHLAVTVQHASTPFSVEVGVDGKLRGHTFRAMRSMFRSQQSTRMATILPQRLQRDLLTEALNLEREIKKKNVLLLPHLADDDEAPGPEEAAKQTEPAKADEPTKRDDSSKLDGSPKFDDAIKKDEPANPDETKNSDETVKKKVPEESDESTSQDDATKPNEHALPAEPDPTPKQVVSTQPNGTPEPDTVSEPSKPSKPSKPDAPTTPHIDPQPDPAPISIRNDQPEATERTIFRSIFMALTELPKRLISLFVQQTLGFLSRLGLVGGSWERQGNGRGIRANSGDERV